MLTCGGTFSARCDGHLDAFPPRLRPPLALRFPLALRSGERHDLDLILAVDVRLQPGSDCGNTSPAFLGSTDSKIASLTSFDSP